jgi:hypothetical protein
MGYEQDRFIDSFSPDLICSICLCVLEDPAECKLCQTNFCLECISSWKAKNNSCPNKCELDLQKSHRFLRSVLDSLKLKCINAPSGCDKILEISQIKTHEGKECAFRRVKCKYANCYEMVLFERIAEHEENCDNRIVVCVKCGEEMKIGVFQDHNCLISMANHVRGLFKTLVSNQEKIERLKEIEKSKIQRANKEVHEGIKCDNCGENPIIGVRNMCLMCENHNECWKCKHNRSGEHEFFQLATTDVHERVTCDICYECPVKGIRYKCKLCVDFGKIYPDLCHKCKVKTGHGDHPLELFSPFSIIVTPLKPERIAYRDGETLIRQWEVFNNSTQEIREILLNCISGDLCGMN